MGLAKRDDLYVTWNKEAGDHLRNAFIVILVTGVAWLGVAALVVLSVFPGNHVPRIMLGAWGLVAVVSLVLPAPRARGLWLDEHDLREYRFKIAPVYPLLWAVGTGRALLRSVYRGPRSR